MSFTDTTLALSAYERMKVMGLQVGPGTVARLVPLIPVSLELLADKVFQGPGWRGLQTDFDVTPAAGVASIPTGMLFDINKSSVRVASSGEYLSPVDDPLTLRYGDLPTGQVYYAVDGSGLRFRTGTSLNTYATALKVRANFIPTLNTLPTQYEGNLVEILASMAGQPHAEEMSATGRS